MGSPSRALALSEPLRAWDSAGLTYVLKTPVNVVANNVNNVNTDDQHDHEGEDPTAWPEPWPTFWIKTPHDPKIVFTYMELSDDLMGKGNPARGPMLRKMIQRLGWPKGTTAFWPMYVPATDARESLNRFWKGVQRLGISTLVTFDSATLAAIAPGAEPQGQWYQYGEYRIYSLPHLDALASFLPHDKLKAIAPLQKIVL